MALATLTSAFRPGVAFYSGKGTSPLVPNTFPVAINARPFLIDRASNQYSRRFDARVRDTVDQSTEPGEAAINPQGLWRRSQSSWHYGAGQKYADTADAEAYRFYASKGVNVWTKGQLTLLPEAEKAYNTTNTNLHLATADSRVYITDGQAVKYTTDLSSFSTVTGTAASDLYDIASDGYNVFYSYANGDIDQTNAGITTSSAYITGIEAGYMRYVKGRLMVAGQGTDKHKIWNITTAPGSSANNPGALFTHPNTSFQWVGFAAGQNHIYAAGHSGNKTIVYKTTIKADGTALDIPTVAGELPLGEICTEIDGYLGYVVIGLENGFRFCSADDNGNLVIGPKIVTGSEVQEFAGVGQYIYFGWKNFDASSTGLGRMDISTFISPNQPAYASDLMVTAQGSIVDVHEFDNKPIFTVSGQGLYKQHASNLVSSGYIETGIYRWGVPDPKFVQRYDIRTLPLAGTIQMSVKSDGGSYTAFTALTEAGETEHLLPGLEDKIFEHEAKVTLNRAAGSTTGPTVTRWMVRAYAAPERSEIITIPVIIHDRINVDGREYAYDVNVELAGLRDLVSNPRVVPYQDGYEVMSAIVEDVVWQPQVMVDRLKGAKMQGTAIVVLRTVK